MNISWKCKENVIRSSIITIPLNMFYLNFVNSKLHKQCFLTDQSRIPQLFRKCGFNTLNFRYMSLWHNIIPTSMETQYIVYRYIFVQLNSPFRLFNVLITNKKEILYSKINIVTSKNHPPHVSLVTWSAFRFELLMNPKYSNSATALVNRALNWH